MHALTSFGFRGNAAFGKESGESICRTCRGSLESGFGGWDEIGSSSTGWRQVT